MVERLLSMQEALGSMPRFSIFFIIFMNFKIIEKVSEESMIFNSHKPNKLLLAYQLNYNFKELSQININNNPHFKSIPKSSNQYFQIKKQSLPQISINGNKSSFFLEKLLFLPS